MPARGPAAPKGPESREAGAFYRLVRIFGKWKLKASSISIELDLMRVKGIPYYIFSERLVDFIKQRGFTNFPFDDVHLS